MQISGLGEMHLEIISKKLKNKFNAEIVLADPKIPYREAIKKSVKAEGKHKKQSADTANTDIAGLNLSPFQTAAQILNLLIK